MTFDLGSACQSFHRSLVLHIDETSRETESNVKIMRTKKILVNFFSRSQFCFIITLFFNLNISKVSLKKTLKNDGFRTIQLRDLPTTSLLYV